MRTITSKRRGFSIIELLATLGVIAVLGSLLMSAVQMARESSRKVHCQNNLRQIGLALAEYETANRAYPPTILVFPFLLPYLGQENLYKEIESQGMHTAQSHTLTHLAIFDCPTDPVSSAAKTAYAVNGGSGLAIADMDGPFRYHRNLIPQQIRKYGPVRTAEVRDGLSNTVAVGEILPTGSSNDSDRRRWNWRTPRLFNLREESAEFIAMCRSVPDRPFDYGWKGSDRGGCWCDANFGEAMYNHTLTPNSVSCTNGHMRINGIFSAASLHPGGVNVVMLDGRVTFVSDAVALPVWRAAATIDGRELHAFNY